MSTLFPYTTLFRSDVDEEIVLAVEMERRRRIRRGHEQKSLDLLEAGIEQAVAAARAGNRQQRVFQKLAIFRRILHALEHHPGSGGLDTLHDLDRIEIDGGDPIRILADRDLAGIIFDQVARQLGGELRD